MKITGIESLGLGIIVAYIMGLSFVLFCWGMGLWLGFAAAIWLGLCLLFVPPAALVCGLAYWLGGIDIPSRLLEWLS